MDHASLSLGLPDEPDPWALSAPEPTNLLALWAEEDAPGLGAVRDAIETALGEAVEVLEEVPVEDDAVRWCAACALPGLSAPVVLWCERARKGTSPPPEDGSDDAPVRVCRWVVGAETVLAESDPLAEYGALLHALARVRPPVVAVLDVNTASWHPRAALDVIGRGVPPAEDALWMVVVRCADASRPDVERRVWLHTQGLWRCRRPELEMLEVPEARAEDAAALLDAVAALSLEQHPPPPGAPFEIGPDLVVTLRPWREVARFVERGAPGALDDERRVDGREGGADHDRAVVCAPEPRGRFRPLWVWPAEAVERAGSGDDAVYMTARAAERRARLAQDAWPAFLDAYTEARRLREGDRGEAEGPGEDRDRRRDGDEPPVRFGVKSAFALEDDATSRAHLWFEVVRVEGDRVEGELVHEPAAVIRLKPGERVWIARDDVTDWRVSFPGVSIGPDDSGRLPRALARVGVASGVAEPHP